jgi:hypothetical protein
MSVSDAKETLKHQVRGLIEASRTCHDDAVIKLAHKVAERAMITAGETLPDKASHDHQIHEYGILLRDAAAAAAAAGKTQTIEAGRLIGHIQQVLTTYMLTLERTGHVLATVSEFGRKRDAFLANAIPYSAIQDLVQEAMRIPEKDLGRALYAEMQRASHELLRVRESMRLLETAPMPPVATGIPGPPLESRGRPRISAPAPLPPPPPPQLRGMLIPVPGARPLALLDGAHVNVDIARKFHNRFWDAFGRTVSPRDVAEYHRFAAAFCETKGAIRPAVLPREQELYGTTMFGMSAEDAGNDDKLAQQMFSRVQCVHDGTERSQPWLLLQFQRETPAVVVVPQEPRVVLFRPLHGAPVELAHTLQKIRVQGLVTPDVGSMGKKQKENGWGPRTCGNVGSWPPYEDVGNGGGGGGGGGLRHGLPEFPAVPTDPPRPQATRVAVPMMR